MGLFGGSKSSQASTVTTITQVDDTKGAGTDAAAVATKNSQAVSGEGAMFGANASVRIESPEAWGVMAESVRAQSDLARSVAEAGLAAGTIASRQAAETSQAAMSSVERREAPETAASANILQTVVYVVGGALAIGVVVWIWKGGR